MNKNANENENIQEENIETEETAAEETAETEAEAVPEKTPEDALREEVEQLKDKVMRQAAEFDNFKKRTAKEREELYAMSVCDTVEKLLPVKDNLERAVAAADADEGNLADGVKMIVKQLDEVFANLGVEPIKAVGEVFNPDLHNAVMHEENEEFGENTVSEELMRGYTCKGRVVRYAMVKVAN
ncbi:MAG: nucleotide exchange factor GrpE [Clostridia bacterium]|nr:nucleotide exchange factor GrpE [Clostridia bacterium]